MTSNKKNKKKKNICVVVASRANYGRIKSTLKAIKKHPKLQLQLIVSASALLDRFGSVVKIIKKDGFYINSSVHIVIEGENPMTMAKSTGLAIIELTTIFKNIKPDFVLTVADRYETMATAIAASYMNIPLVHTQGGEVTGSIDESVRHAITKLAHIHFPSTAKSVKRLIKMGENKKFIFNVGCPSIDTLKKQKLSIKHLKDLKKGVGGNINLNNPYLLVIQHPVTTEYESNISEISETIAAIEKLKMQTLWLWPNIDAGSDQISKKLRIFRETKEAKYIRFFKNFSPEDYNIILNNAAVAVGNSSSFIREGSFLGVPAVNIGSRQNNRERGSNIIDVIPKKNEILKAITQQLKRKRFKKSNLFGKGDAGIKIANILSNTNPPIQKVLKY